jgi:hypothetical protein
VDGSDLLLVAGVVMLVLGAFASKLPPPLRTKRRWLVIGGVALLLVSAVIGWPHITQGFKDGVNGR